MTVVKKKAVAKRPEATVTGINPIIQMVMSGNAEPGVLDKMLDVQEKWEANEARKAFNMDLAAFREEAPVLEKDSHVYYEYNGKVTDYHHATLGGALKVLNPVLGKHHLTPSWRTHQSDNGVVKVTCVLTHAQGHNETTSLMAAPDAGAGKNSIQAVGSTVTYLQRYTLFALLGIAAEDAETDDDGRGAGKPEVEYITEDQVLTIVSSINDNKLDMPKFMQWLKKAMKADEIEKISVDAYKDVISQLERTIKAHQKREK